MSGHDTTRAVDAEPVLLTVPEACERLRISRWTLYRLIHQRQLRTVQIGSRRLIEAAAVSDLIAQLAQEEAT